MITRYTVLLFFSILIISCSTDNSDPEPEVMTDDTQEIPNDDNNGTDEGDNSTLELPQIVVAGESISSEDGYKVREWNDDYSSSTDTNVLAMTSGTYDSPSFFGRDFFYFQETTSQNPYIYRFDVDSGQLQFLQHETFFNPTQDVSGILIKENMFKNVINTYYAINQDLPYVYGLYSYNVVTGNGQDIFLGPGYIHLPHFRLNTASYGNYAITLIEEDNDTIVLNRSDLSTGINMKIDFTPYRNILYIPDNNVLYLFRQDSQGIQDYDIYDLETGTLSGDGTFPSILVSNSKFIKAQFHENQMVYERGVAGPSSSSIKTVVDLDNGDTSYFNFDSLYGPLLTQTDYSISNLGIVEIDLETEIACVAFRYSDGNDFKAAIAFVNFEYNVIQVVETGDVNPEYIYIKN